MKFYYAIASLLFAMTLANTEKPDMGGLTPPPPVAPSPPAAPSPPVKPPTCPAIEITTDPNAPFCDTVVPAGCPLPGSVLGELAGRSGGPSMNGTTTAAAEPASTEAKTEPTDPPAGSGGKSSVDGESSQKSTNSAGKFAVSGALVGGAVLSGIILL
ncbi:hypothetical protein MP638_007556 [Amoeboaphelidium occidentale]|nr:hypothetical protein MP638_007556 [Amoeboaphelidium occidentale]